MKDNKLSNTLSTIDKILSTAYLLLSVICLYNTFRDSRKSRNMAKGIFGEEK